GAPGDTAGLGRMPRDQQVEGVGHAGDARQLELGAAFRDVADDAVPRGAAAVEDDPGLDAGIAAGREPPLRTKGHYATAYKWRRVRSRRGRRTQPAASSSG